MPSVRHRVEITGQVVAQHELTTIVIVIAITTPTIAIIIGTTTTIAMIVIKAATVIPITDTIGKIIRDETQLSITTIVHATSTIATMMFITIAETIHISRTMEDVGW
jgi:hypothetical protein